MSVIKGLDYSFDVGLSIYNENEKTNKKSTNKKMKIGKKDFSLNEIKEIISDLDDLEHKFLKIFDDIDSTDVIIQKVIDTTFEYKQPKIILEHYFILPNIRKHYHTNYSNGFFDKLFIGLYLKFPRTILALFIESPNYQFFRYFLVFIESSINSYTDTEDQESLYKLYNLIILLFSIQLNKDYRTIKEYPPTEYRLPIISDASLHAPSKKDCTDNNIFTIRKNISDKLIDCKCCKHNSLKDYDNVIEILRFNIVAFKHKNPNYSYENEMNMESAKKCCFKLFYHNFKLDTNLDTNLVSK